VSGDERGDEPRRFNREAFDRELNGLRDALKGPSVSAPMTASELYELERLIHKYPVQARRIVAALDERQ
jgi:hypothetical protein